MADSLAVFDINVFDPGVFDSLEITPIVVRLSVPPDMWYSELGQSVSIFAYIFNFETTPGHGFPVSPPTPPQIEIYDPLDVIDVAFTNMTEINTGVYLYQYTVPANGLNGAYAARVKTFNGSKTSLSRKVVFTTVPE